MGFIKCFEENVRVSRKKNDVVFKNLREVRALYFNNIVVEREDLKL